MNTLKILAFAAVALILSHAFAASPYKQSLTVKKNAYVRDGVFTGGNAGSGMTLLGVRRAFSAKAELERLIFDIGNREGQPAGANLGYFQAAVDAKLNRVTLDLAQLQMSAVGEQAFRNLMKKSPYVASAEFTVDPEDKTGSLVLNFKRPMQLEVFEMIQKNKPARIFMDMKPATAMSVKTR